MPAAEAAQLVLGFCIPFLLTEHVVSTRVADTWFHADFGYFVSVLLQYRVLTPGLGANQFVVLVVAWVHAMIGLRYSLALRPWYPRWQPYLFAAALLLPTFAILGVIEGGTQVAAMAKDPAVLAQLQADHPHAAPARRTSPMSMLLTAWLRFGFFAALLGGAGARVAALAVAALARHRAHDLSERPGGRDRARPLGARGEPARRHSPRLGVRRARALLDLPHPGRGRPRPPAAALGRRGQGAGLRVGAAPDVRLACQLRPLGDLCGDAAAAALGAGQRRVPPRRLSPRHGKGDRDPLRRHPRLHRTVRAKLPYDVVFLLNRYFAEMGDAVERAGGRIDKFIGDGVMALFGLDSGPAPAAARRSPRRAPWRSGWSSSTARSRTTCPSRCASASASMSGRRSSARWAMARRCR